MRRVVITGLGAVSPTGLDAQTSFRAAVECRSGIAPITLFDTTGYTCTIAGECTGFEAEHHLAKKEVRTMDRFIHLAIAAAAEGLRDAGVASFDDEMRERTAVILGVGIGGLGTIESTHRVLAEKGPSRISP